MKKFIVTATLITSLSLATIAFAQSTVSGTLSSGGTTGTTGSTGSNTVTGTVGSGNSLTGTVSSPSSGSTGGGGGGTTAASNGPVVGGGGGGGSNTIIICPNLPNSLYTLPAGYGIVNGNCDPLTVTTAPGIPNTGVTPGIPNTGAGGNMETNAFLLLVTGVLGIAAGVGAYRGLNAR